MRVAIVGSRSIPIEVYPQIVSYIPDNATQIVSGCAAGADQIAELYASEQKLPLRTFRPDYQQYHRRAPLIRNREIVLASDYVLVLWDGSSRGSANVIQLCIEEYVPVRVLIIRDGKLVETLFGQETGRLF